MRPMRCRRKKWLTPPRRLKVARVALCVPSDQIPLMRLCQGDFCIRERRM